MKLSHAALSLIVSLTLSGCASSPIVVLVNPETQTAIECTGSGRGAAGAPAAEKYVEDCARQYEALGYIRADKLPASQRGKIKIKSIYRSKGEPTPDPPAGSGTQHCVQTGPGTSFCY